MCPLFEIWEYVQTAWHAYCCFCTHVNMPQSMGFKHKGNFCLWMWPQFMKSHLGCYLKSDFYLFTVTAKSMFWESCMHGCMNLVLRVMDLQQPCSGHQMVSPSKLLLINVNWFTSHKSANWKRGQFRYSSPYFQFLKRFKLKSLGLQKCDTHVGPNWVLHQKKAYVAIFKNVNYLIDFLRKVDLKVTLTEIPLALNT